MRLFLTALIALAAICPALPAQADVAIAKARAKASLDLAVRQRERDAIAAAKTKAESALKKMCQSRECMEDYSAAIERAKREARPLILWVGFDCKSEPALRRAFPDAIHCHVDAMNGSTAPRIVAGWATDREFMSIMRSAISDWTPEIIRARLAAPKQSSLAPLYQSVTWGAAVCST